MSAVFQIEEVLRVLAPEWIGFTLMVHRPAVAAFLPSTRDGHLQCFGNFFDLNFFAREYSQPEVLVAPFPELIVNIRDDDVVAIGFPLKGAQGDILRHFSQDVSLNLDEIGI